ncbi:MAG TPA: ABC transporter permease [Vicinamibacterales bacterium]|nr:ABC transporter permease [Vicinamibacterales bacterium]
MTWLDTWRLALANLGQAKLRTILTVSGVAVGIGALTCMVSFGVGLEDQLVGRLTGSGMFDSILVTMPNPRVAPGRGRQAAPARGGERGAPPRGGRAATANDTPAIQTPEPATEPPRLRLNDEALAKIAALPNVKSVRPDLRLLMQVTYKDYEGPTPVTGVPLSAAGEGGFQTIAAGSFFANETDDACMVSLDFAKRLQSDDPKTLVGQSLKLTYAAASPKGNSTGAPAPVPDGAGALAGILSTQQITRIDTGCKVVGIVERETAPGMMGSAVSSLMLPFERARAINAVQVTSVESVLRRNEPPSYNTVTVKASSAAHTLDVEEEIKKLGYSAFSLNDALKNAKRAFLLLDIFLSLVGSIALVVSSLGIINTMVMSILERTREIGIMKAIGGSDRNIRGIFLIEAAAIGLLGGVMGVILGWAVGGLINFIANWWIEREGGTAGDLFSLPLWLIASAVGFSIVVSLLAGLYPARRAARLDPIQALRHD